jgi:hypothetical protein
MRNNQLSNHILFISSTMVGACLTMLSIIKLIPEHMISRWADDLLTLVSIIFLFSTLLCQLGVTSRERK